MPITAAAALIATGLLSLCPAQTADESEPNDRADQAQPIADGTRVVGSLSSTADVDWYSFALTEPRLVHVRVRTSALPWQAQRESLVALYDASGTRRLAWNERDGLGNDCGVTLPAGSYRCLVAMKPQGTPGDYVLELATTAPRPIDVRETHEPNDNPVLGGEPVAFALGDTIAGELAAAGDVDWFVFEVRERGIARVLCLDDGAAPQLDSTRLQFWRETTAGRWTPFGTPSYTRTSHRALDLVHTSELPGGNYLTAGRYAIQVDASTATPAGAAPWDYRKVGHYALRTAWIALPGAATRQEGPEPNDDAATATALTLGDDARGAIDGDGDADWFRFEVATPTTIAATAEGTGANPLPVASVRLWSATGTALASGTATPSAHGRLVHTIERPGTYFVEVKGRLFADAGSYVLHTGACVPLHVTTPRLDGAWAAEASSGPPPADDDEATTRGRPL